MKKHISVVKKFCVGQLKSWKHIATFLDEDVRLLLVKQIILSKIDYNNSLFISLPNYLIQELQFIVNSAIRFIYNIRYRDHITPYIEKSHILPVKYRIDYKVCLTAFNCLHNCAPDYLQPLLTWNIPSHEVLNISGIPRTTQDPFRLVVPSDFGSRSRYRSRSFSHYTPRVWNDLPYEIRSCCIKLDFKSKLKTQYFNTFLNNTN